MLIYKCGSFEFLQSPTKSLGGRLSIGLFISSMMDIVTQRLCSGTSGDEHHTSDRPLSGKVNETMYCQ